MAAPSLHREHIGTFGTKAGSGAGHRVPRGMKNCRHVIYGVVNDKWRFDFSHTHPLSRIEWTWELDTRSFTIQHVNMLQELFQLAATKQEQLLTESGPILAASRGNPMASFELHMTQIKQFPFQMQISG